ncbi:hypothetical protein CFC21_017455 [Triticum aestivum]|uniref:G-patch domain-containing protein n=2 Tax=Triticum aestivum TaxID=4565 RepID=A0A3B6B0Z4_WHEAT|nr:hypothetical protein CFC21_017455 [Triticum aestivum]
MAISIDVSTLLDGNDSGENKPPNPSDMSSSFVFLPSRAVKNMMRRWNYREGSGLGAQGQGIVVPIQAAVRVRRRPKAGLGYREKPYDNGLHVPPEPPVEEECREWEGIARAMRLETECCETILALLHDMRLQGDDSVETTDALKAMAESKNGLHGKRVLGTWKARLPSSTARYIIEQVVTPRMAVDVREWKSSWDPDCHDWLRPFIPLIGHLPESLYGTRGEQDQERKRHILPMLTRLVREMRITPPKQTDPSFRTVMLWAPLLRAQDVVSILEAEQFFDKWEGALQHWLQAAKPSLGEATAWCTGWKTLFTPELLADESVLAHLEAGLDMVDPAMQDLDSLFSNL